MWLVFHRESISKEGDNTTEFATTPAADCRTGFGRTKYCDIHSPNEQADISKCTGRRNNNGTLKTAKCPPREWMANTPANQSRSHISKLQSWMRFQLNRYNPNINGCYWRSIVQSSLPNPYGSRKSRNRLVVGGGTTYTEGCTYQD